MILRDQGEAPQSSVWSGRLRFRAAWRSRRGLSGLRAGRMKSRNSGHEEGASPPSAPRREKPARPGVSSRPLRARGGGFFMSAGRAARCSAPTRAIHGFAPAPACGEGSAWAMSGDCEGRDAATASQRAFMSAGRPLLLLPTGAPILRGESSALESRKIASPIARLRKQIRHRLDPAAVKPAPRFGSDSG